MLTDVEMIIMTYSCVEPKSSCIEPIKCPGLSDKWVLSGSEILRRGRPSPHVKEWT